jgi:multidrug efflux pump subunit AcrB
MMAVVLSFVGVFGGLLVSKLAFGVIMTGIGVIGLAGVVVNNGIVLISYTKQLEARGLDTLSAIVKAGKTRLRPVLLTAITTILGLLPMAIGLSFNVHDATWDLGSETSQWWQNMAVSVIWGLAVATFLTLLLEPVLYSLFTRAEKHHREYMAEHEASLETVSEDGTE